MKRQNAIKPCNERRVRKMETDAKKISSKITAKRDVRLDSSLFSLIYFLLIVT